MAKYFGTFSCGHEGYVNVIGPGKDRQWKIDRAFSNMCSDCYKKHLEEERKRRNEEILLKTKDMELPELEGTPKQIQWAIKLRYAQIEVISKEIDLIKGIYSSDKSERYNGRNAIEGLEIALNLRKKDFDNKDELYKYILKCLYKAQEMIISNTKATYFINNRFTGLFDFLQENADYLKNFERIDEEIEIKNEIIKETTIEPKDVKFNGVANIDVNPNLIKVYYEKDEIFISIVKDLRFKWNYDERCWQRKLNELTGSYIDRTAELANKLLNTGFRVSIPEQEIKEKALNGLYEQECDRWILRRKDTNNLVIKCYGKSDNVYDVAKYLKGSRWDNRSILVNVNHYEQVEEFAEMYGFKFSKSAINLIEQYKKELSNIEKVEVATVEKIKNKNGLEDILNSSRNVLDDLLEED